MGRTRDARRVIKVPAVWAGRHARIEGGWFDRILWAGKHAGHIHPSRRSQSKGPVFETHSEAWMPLSGGIHFHFVDKVDASRRAEKCRSLRVKVEVGVATASRVESDSALGVSSEDGAKRHR
jgi:hypothetical protein